MQALFVAYPSVALPVVDALVSTDEDATGSAGDAVEAGGAAVARADELFPDGAVLWLIGVALHASSQVAASQLTASRGFNRMK